MAGGHAEGRRAFHLDLMSELAPRGLALKTRCRETSCSTQRGPYSSTSFHSCQTESLAEEQWLLEGSDGRPPWRIVMERMFFPYFVVPLLAMAAGDYKLRGRCCRRKPATAAVPNRAERSSSVRRGIVTRLRALFRYTALRAALRGKRIHGRRASASGLLQTLDVTPRQSDYLDYYAAKREEVRARRSRGVESEAEKHRRHLVSSQPATVLDLGANTGWFSRLAARHGARVIATDIDEAAIDDLYLRARTGGLSILPLRLSFGELAKAVSCPAAEGMFLPATERLQSDLVCCLGLLHHLVLGEGRSLREVLEVLSTLARRTLVIELITLDDPLIRENPGFFPKLTQHSATTYSLDALLEAGQPMFRTFTVMESHPATRTLVVFEK